MKLISESSKRIVLCKRKGCGREAVCRGLCDPDYQGVRRKVKNGEYTWEYLERIGAVDPVETLQDWIRELEGLHHAGSNQVEGPVRETTVAVGPASERLVFDSRQPAGMGAR